MLEDVLRRPESGRTVAGPTQAEQRSLRGKRILVVEDEALISLDLETRLTAAGCEVIGPAATLEHARRLIADAECDAALVDGNLAGHPVDELAIALTQRSVPFAFVTGYGRDVLPHGFREAVVLAKPFSQDQLLAAVQAILGWSGRHPVAAQGELMDRRDRRCPGQ